MNHKNGTRLEHATLAIDSRHDSRRDTAPHPRTNPFTSIQIFYRTGSKAQHESLETQTKHKWTSDKGTCPPTRLILAKHTTPTCRRHRQISARCYRTLTYYMHPKQKRSAFSSGQESKTPRYSGDPRTVPRISPLDIVSSELKKGTRKSSFQRVLRERSQQSFQSNTHQCA